MAEVIDLVKALGPAGASVVVTIFFLRHLNGRDEAERRAEESRAATLQTINDNCHEFHSSMMERAEGMFDRVLEAMGDAGAVSKEQREYLDELKQYIETRLHA